MIPILAESFYVWESEHAFRHAQTPLTERLRTKRMLASSV